MAELNNQEVRVKIRNGFQEYKGEYPCAEELLTYATDTDIMGFEDARSQAVETIMNDWGSVFYDKAGRGECLVDTCGAKFEVNFSKDTYKVIGNCSMKDVCLNDEFSQVDENGFDKIFKVGQVRGGETSIGSSCPHLNCGYSCGVAEGGIGEAGECRNGDKPSDI